MSAPDLINASIEVVAGTLLWVNVLRAWRHKQIRGMHWVSTGFFTLCGAWNLFYYPHLHQWASTAVAILPLSANLAWLALYRRYHGR